MAWLVKFNCQWISCFAVSVNVRCLVVLLIAVMACVSAEASPDRQKLEELKQADGVERTHEILQEFEQWASGLGYEGVRAWLEMPLESGDTSTYPIVLLGNNVLAMWWFIRHAFPIEQMNRENDEGVPDELVDKLADLLLILVRSHDSDQLSNGLNTLLQNAFEWPGTTEFAELLYLAVTTIAEDHRIAIDVRSLTVKALHQNNSQLINFLFNRFVYWEHRTDSFFYVLVSELAAQPQLWEIHSGDFELSHSPAHIPGSGQWMFNCLSDPSDGIPDGFATEPDQPAGTQQSASALNSLALEQHFYSHSSDDSSGSSLPDYLSDISEALSNHVALNPRWFSGALQTALQAGNSQAVEWLQSLGVSTTNTVVEAYLPSAGPLVIVERTDRGRASRRWHSFITDCFSRFSF